MTTEPNSAVATLGRITNYLHPYEYETVGESIDDSDAVQNCIDHAIDYFHQNLSPTIREYIHEQWGIEDKAIDALKIGYTNGDVADETVIHYLRESGFSELTICRAGFATIPGFNHVFSCNPIESDCRHEIPDDLDTLSALLSLSTDTQNPHEFINPTKIDIAAVYERLAEYQDTIHLSHWWDSRIIFPYVNEDGDYSYLIGRKTPDTEDKFYSNNIEDNTDFSDVSITVRIDDGQLQVDPPATAVKPGTSIIFLNQSNQEATLDVEYASNDKWSNGSLDDLSALQCTDGGTYLFSISIGDQTSRGAILCTDSFNKEYRYDPIENWLEPSPHYHLDWAKYLKHTVNKPWVNRNVIAEPMFGIQTVMEDKPLLITEGVSDAVMAHQNGIPCISPCTTEFKPKHYPELLSISEMASSVFIVMDNEENDAGLNGALKTTKFLRNSGIDAKLGIIPRDASVEKIDVADYLRDHSRDEFKTILTNAICPSEHPLYDDTKHNPGTLTESENSSPKSHAPPSTPHGSPAGDSEFDPADSGSAIYSVSILDAASPSQFDSNPSGGGQHLGRGENPFTTTGSNSFIILDDSAAFDHHSSVKEYYNGLTWMACDTGCRNPTSPQGTFSDEEIWHVWKHAKTTEYVDFPHPEGSWEDDPIPKRAMWHLARVHDLAPQSVIPDSFDDPKLPATIYNRVLETIEDTYDLNPGREPLVD